VVSRLRRFPHSLHYGRGRVLMSELRKLRVRLLHPDARIEFGPGTYLGPGFSLEIPGRGTFVTGERVEFRRGFRAEVAGEGRIVLGAGTICTYDVLMQCTTSIDVGERCMFGQSTIVVDGQHRFRDITRPMLEQGYDFEPITIGDDAVITSKCTIMTSVGERAFIAANAVLTRPAPPHCVLGGVPARVLDYFGPPGGEPEGWSRPASSQA
jgi:acetyltransferase-like isoleucine patch superfamily enzyme